MTFFYNLNKKLDEIRATPEATHSQLNERNMSRAAKGYEKYGKEGMEALAKAGREGKALDPVRAKYDKYDNTEVDEGLGDMARKVGSMAKRVGSKAIDTLGHGSDADQIRDLQRKMGLPQTGMKPGNEPNPKIIKKGAAAGRDDLEEVSRGEYIDHEKTKAKMQGKTTAHAFGQDMPIDESDMPMSPKQKSFADKIAGAKKEVDEMLGDVAAEAMRSALSPKQKKIDMNKNGKLDANDFSMLRKGGKQETDEASQDNAFTAHKRPRAEVPKVGTTTHGVKHDTTEVPGGRRVTRRTDAGGMSVGAEDDAPSASAPRGRGRPKGPAKAPERVTGGATKHKGGRKTNEGDQDPTDTGEYDQEGEMAKDTIQTVVRHAQALQKILGDNENLPEWVQSKLAKIEGMMTAVDDYMQNQDGDDQDTEEPIAEKAVSKKQQKFMGMVHATQKGEKAPSKEVAKVAKEMPKKAAKDFASTKQKGLPEKAPKKKEKTEEAGGTSTPTASSGFGYGKGIYDSMSRELENMIAESMTVNMSDSTEGGKSLTITATDDDAMKLAVMLKSAGLGGDMSSDDTHGHEESCSSCGESPCGCDGEMYENQPDYPTNTQTAQDNFGYAGGLNKPKSTGQTTVPVIASQDERQMAYESDLRRMREIAGIQEAKAKPDFLDADEDGNEKESMSKALDDKKKNPFGSKDSDKEKKVRESIFDLTNQWRAYKG